MLKLLSCNCSTLDFSYRNHLILKRFQTFFSDLTMKKKQTIDKGKSEKISQFFINISQTNEYLGCNKVRLKIDLKSGMLKVSKIKLKYRLPPYNFNHNKRYFLLFSLTR